MNDHARLLQIAQTAALAGGALLRARVGDLGAVRTKSSASDMVTEVDVASGVEVVRSILSALPHARCLVEEPEVYGLTGIEPASLDEPEVWVIDPIDGTTSYIHGFPCYSVSVAVLRDGQPVAGAVYNAASGVMTSASAGGGATADGVPIHCTDVGSIEEALLITGFPYDRTATLDRQIAIFGHMIRRVHGIRRDGSAAIDCCHVAAGKADGFWELSLRPWDVAAGIVILREAGALVTDTSGASWTVETADHIIAGPRLHRVLLETIGGILQDYDATSAAPHAQ